jgi:uncharacterized LabA/DUF88 family protein
MAENTVESKDYKLAVLIDGDNAQASLLSKMLAEIGKHGSVTIRRIYGDWTTSNMNSWKDALHNYAVQPIQQFRYTVGKNATDSTLIIDAMDIMHRKLVEGFCIISSDSDYTRLATRIREEGVFVMGIGQQKTPKSFVNACDLFIYTENLAPRRENKPRPESAGKARKKIEMYAGADPMPLLREAYEMVVQENGWANLGPMGKALLQLDPGFDPRSYGQRQLSSLIKSLPDFELRRSDEHSQTGVWVRLKE